MHAEGSNGSVELLKDRIVIRRKGIANVLTQGIQGDKSIPLSSITAIQFKPAGSFLGGLIQFTILGGREFRGGMLEATKDENAVIFDLTQQPAFEKLRDAIEAARFRTPQHSQSTVDDLLKLAELLEKGLLTRDEFDQKKRGLFNNELKELTSHPERDNDEHLLPLSEKPVHPTNKRETGFSPLSTGCVVLIAIFIFLLVLGQIFALK